MAPPKKDSKSETRSKGGRWLAAGTAGAIGVVVTLESISGPSDALVMPDPPLTEPAVLVTAKPLDGLCPTFRTGVLYQLTDRVSLEQNYTSGCAFSLTVFAINNAVEVGNPENDWSDALEDHTVATPGPMVTVELRVWNATAMGSELDPEVDADIKRANGVFQSERAGLVLQRQSEIKKFTPQREYSITHNCDAVDSILGFTIDPVRVNVVYLDSFVDIRGDSIYPSTASGYACTRHNRPPPVVFLSHQHMNDLTLAHEVGHIVGHSSEEFPATGGHSTGREGLDSTNLMWRSMALLSDPRSRFALGQIFRAHLDSRSWINRAPLRTGLKLLCKEEQLNGALVDSAVQDGLEPCPRLSMGEEPF